MNKRQFVKLLAGLPFVPLVARVAPWLSSIGGLCGMKQISPPVYCASNYQGDWNFIVIQHGNKTVTYWQKDADANN